MQSIKIGTRASPLALAQAREVQRRLGAAWPELARNSATELVQFTTSGDNFLSGPLSDIGNKGLFTKELDEALIDGRIDIAVHSMKDVATQLPEGLEAVAFLPREDPRDMLVGKGLTTLKDMPPGTRFGTSSLRRAAIVRMHRPDVEIVPLRGNVQTRLDKIARGEVDATMLAKAGLNRLGFEEVPGQVLSLQECLPAIAQGAIGITCRIEDVPMHSYLAALNDEATEQAVTAERAFLRVMDGSCRTPIAGYATVEKGLLYLRGLVLKPDGSEFYEVSLHGQDAKKLGEEAGEKLLAQCGHKFLS